MVILHHVWPYLKDVFLQHIGPMVGVWWIVLVLMEPISEVALVSPMFLAKMVKCGIIIWSIAYVLKEPNGMVKNVWPVQEVKHGSHLSAVFVPQDTSSQDPDVREWLKIDVFWSLIPSGIVTNVYAMKVFMWLGCNVFVMEWWWGIDVIDVPIGLILNGNMANADVSKGTPSMEPNV